MTPRERVARTEEIRALIGVLAADLAVMPATPARSDAYGDLDTAYAAIAAAGRKLATE